MSLNQQVEDYLDAAARLLALPIRPEHRQEVLAAYHVLAEQAKLVTEFGLPDGVHAAPLFIP